MLRLGPFGANGELEFVGRLIVDLCELAAPIAGNVWSRRRGLFLRGAGEGRSVSDGPANLLAALCFSFSY